MTGYALYLLRHVIRLDAKAPIQVLIARTGGDTLEFWEYIS